MRKVLIGILVLIVSFSIFCLIKKSSLSMPTYPLDVKTIETALEKRNPWNTEYIIVDIDAGFSTESNPHSILYSINNAKDEDEWMLTSILTVAREGEYSFNMTLLPFHSRYPLPLEDSKNLFAFVSDLFGNFKNSNSLYNNFIADYNSGNNIESREQKLPTGSERTAEKVSLWECSIDGIDCRIRIEQPLLDSPDAYIVDIWLSTNMEMFFW